MKEEVLLGTIKSYNVVPIPTSKMDVYVCKVEDFSSAVVIIAGVVSPPASRENKISLSLVVSVVKQGLSAFPQPQSHLEEMLCRYSLHGFPRWFLVSLVVDEGKARSYYRQHRRK